MACGRENKQVASVRMPLSSSSLHARMLSGVAGIFIQTRSLGNELSVCILKMEQENLLT